MKPRLYRSADESWGSGHYRTKIGAAWGVRDFAGGHEATKRG